MTPLKTSVRSRNSGTSDTRSSSLHRAALKRPRPVEQHELLGLTYGKPSKEDLVQQRKDRRVGANPQTEGQHDDGREPEILPEAAERKADVVEHGVSNHRFGAGCVLLNHDSQMKVGAGGDCSGRIVESEPCKRCQRLVYRFKLFLC